VRIQELNKEKVTVPGRKVHSQTAILIISDKDKSLHN
jgi:hypothetical protein